MNEKCKTALDVANEFAKDFPDGAWFAYLEEQAEPFETDEMDANSLVHLWLFERNSK